MVWILTCVLSLSSYYSSACDLTTGDYWIGDVSSDWNDDNNWEYDDNPNATFVIDAGSYTNPPVISTASTQGNYGIQIQNGGVLTIQANINTNNNGVSVSGTNSSLVISNGTVTVGNGNITVSSSATVRINGATVTAADLNVSGNSATFDFDAGTLTLSDDLIIGSGGIITIDAAGISGSGGSNAIDGTGGGSITLPDDAYWPSGFETTDLSGCTITYNGASEAVNTDGVIGALILTGSGTKTTSGTLQVVGDISIADGVTLDPQNNQVEIGGDWNNNNSIASAGFTKGTGTVVFNGSGAQQINQSGGAESFYNITIDNSAGVTSNIDLNVSNTFTLTDGVFDIGANNVVLESTAEFSGGGTSAFINASSGTVTQNAIGTGNRTGDVLFPVGVNATEYAPVTINNAGTSDNFSVMVSPNVYETYGPPADQIVADAVDQTWFIDEAVAGGSDVTLTIGWTAARELGGFDRNGCFISHYNTTENEWEMLIMPEPAAGADPYTLTVEGVDDFSPFGVGDGSSNTLPVELTSFDAQRSGKNVTVQWETATETNNEVFLVQRSIDGINQETIARISGAGNSNEMLSYSYTDMEAPASELYYRIVQVDFDGTATQYEYDQVEALSAITKSSNFYPNPLQGADVLKFESNEMSEEIVVTLVNNMGQEVFSKVVLNESGSILNIETSELDLAPGMYLITAASNESVVSERILVK